ncbi:MAG: MBL fold metallo-hydrolase [Acidimicrobiales bacterium]
MLCTHLHFDHVGWNTVRVDDRWVPTFPNARYLIAATELDHVRRDDHMGVLEPSVQPLLDAGLVDAVATDHRVTSEVRLLPTPGHTPGHVSVTIESAGRRATITGDAVHSPLQFTYPELAASRFDHDSMQSTETRRALIEAHADVDVLVLGTHFAPPAAGHLHTVDGTVRFLGQATPPAG